MSIFIFALFALSIAGWTGHRYFRSYVWDWIDGVYFPLAAVALILFLGNIDVHRQFLSVREALLTKRIGLNEAEIKRLGLPKLQKALGETLPPSEFAAIHEIAAFGRNCLESAHPQNALTTGAPGTGDFVGAPGLSSEVRSSASLPECLAARNFLPALAEFQDGTKRDKRKKRYQIVDKLYVDCAAGSTMVEAIRLEGKVYGPVAEGMSRTYNELLDRTVDPSRFREEALPVIEGHIDRNRFSGEAVSRMAGAELSAASRQELEVRRHEAEISGRILADLKPCMILKPDELFLLQSMLHKDSLYELRNERIAWLKSQRVQVDRRVHSQPWLAWLRLDLWPYLLAIVVSLKFGRLLASKRRDRVG